MSASERGEYRAIYSVLIDSPEFLRLKPGGRLMFYTLKLRLGPSGIGVIPAMIANLSEATGLTAVQTTDALSELEGGDWIRTEGNIVWIVNGLRYEPSISSKNVNHRSSVLTYLNSLPRLKIVDDFRRYYAEWLQIDPPDESTVISDAPGDLPLPKEKPTKKPRAIPSSWVADGVAWWTENVGTINHGRFGTALKLLVDKYGWERVFAALQTYVANEANQVRIEWFASNGVRLIEAAGRPAKGAKKPQWQQEEEDAGMAKTPGISDAVKDYITILDSNGNGEGAEWWTRMKQEAKSLKRHAVVYAWEHLPRDQT
jgi:hypothetical protein